MNAGVMVTMAAVMSGYVVPSLRTGLRLGRSVYLRASLVNLTDVAYKTHGSGIHQSGRNLIIGLEVQGWLPQAGGP